jgi:hypothetical protein
VLGHCHTRATKVEGIHIQLQLCGFKPTGQNSVHMADFCVIMRTEPMPAPGWPPSVDGRQGVKQPNTWFIYFDFTYHKFNDAVRSDYIAATCKMTRDSAKPSETSIKISMYSQFFPNIFILMQSHPVKSSHVLEYHKR